MQHSWPLLAPLLFTAAGCSSSGNTPDQVVGVDDVRQACDLESAWTRRSSSACSDCIGLATTPRCACADVDYAGKCSLPVSAKVKEPTCDGVDPCLTRCGTNCDCVEQCYAGRPACREHASAADGCVAEICASYCR